MIISSNKSGQTSEIDEEEIKALKSENETSMATVVVAPTITIESSIAMLARNSVIIGCLGFLLITVSDFLRNNGPSTIGSLRIGGNPSRRWGGAVHEGYFTLESSLDKDNSNDEINVFKFAAVTDLDQLSDMHESKLTFKSFLLPGTITRELSTDRYSIKFEPKRLLTSKHNQGGRGMELSELTVYENRLLSFDDKTGDVFEILNSNNGQDSFVVPRFIFTEGNGETEKGMKWEWATVKDGELYMGSWGKEFLNDDGSIHDMNNFWIVKIDRFGKIHRVNWYERYDRVRSVLSAQAPGYVLHEAISWSEHLKMWVIAPRRISITPYDDADTERKGANKLVLCDEQFTECHVKDIQMSTLDPLRGFSSLAFVPNTNDEHAIAIRSVEEDCFSDDLSQCKQRSYFMIFNVLTGQVLLDEVKYEDNLKFEGIEFVDAFTPEQK